MGAKIIIIGNAYNMKRVNHPDKANVYWYCLEFSEEGFPDTPKHLPGSSRVHYTVIMNERQMKKLKDEILSDDLTNFPLFVEGEINLDLPLNIVEGEIGIIAKLVRPVEVKDESDDDHWGEEEGLTHEAFADVENADVPFYEKRPQRFMASMEEIIIPSAYLEKKPFDKKIRSLVEYYNRMGHLDKPIMVKKVKNGLLLQDGYTRYVAAKYIGIKEIEVNIMSLLILASSGGVHHLFDHLVDFVSDMAFMGLDGALASLFGGAFDFLCFAGSQLLNLV